MMPPDQEFKRRFVMRGEKTFEQFPIRRPAFPAGREDLPQVFQ